MSYTVQCQASGSPAILMAQLCCGHVYISELSDAVNQAPWVLLSMFMFLLLIFLLEEGCCVLTEQLPEVKDTTEPHETLPYICLFLRHSTRPTQTHTQTHHTQ